MQLVQGQRYRGRGIVGTPVGVNENNARSRLEQKGFTNVQVWLEPEALPADWPANKRGDDSGYTETQVWVEATWGQPSGQMEESGTGWRVVDVWAVAGAAPADDFEGTCVPEGYQCNPASTEFACCPGTRCDYDSVTGTSRCVALAAPVGGDVVTAKKDEGHSWLWWVGAAVGVAAVGYAGWYGWHRWGRKHNPVGEAWRTLQVGDEVELVHPISRMERELLLKRGRVTGVIVRFTKPHGYTVVETDSGTYWLHPEGLVQRKHNPVGDRYGIEGEKDGYTLNNKQEAIEGARALVEGDQAFAFVRDLRTDVIVQVFWQGEAKDGYWEVLGSSNPKEIGRLARTFGWGRKHNPTDTVFLRKRRDLLERKHNALSEKYRARDGNRWQDYLTSEEHKELVHVNQEIGEIDHYLETGRWP